MRLNCFYFFIVRNHHLSLILHAFNSKDSGQASQTTCSIYQDSTKEELLNKMHITLVQRQCVEDLKLKIIEDIFQLIHEKGNLLFSVIFLSFTIF